MGILTMFLTLNKIASDMIYGVPAHWYTSQKIALKTCPHLSQINMTVSQGENATKLSLPMYPLMTFDGTKLVDDPQVEWSIPNGTMLEPGVYKQSIVGYSLREPLERTSCVSTIKVSESSQIFSKCPVSVTHYIPDGSYDVAVDYSYSLFPSKGSYVYEVVGPKRADKVQVGVHQVILRAVDAQNNHEDCSFPVIVYKNSHEHAKHTLPQNLHDQHFWEQHHHSYEQHQKIAQDLNDNYHALYEHHHPIYYNHHGDVVHPHHPDHHQDIGYGGKREYYWSHHEVSPHPHMHKTQPHSHNYSINHRIINVDHLHPKHMHSEHFNTDKPCAPGMEGCASWIDVPINFYGSRRAESVPSMTRYSEHLAVPQRTIHDQLHSLENERARYNDQVAYRDNVIAHTTDAAERASLIANLEQYKNTVGVDIANRTEQLNTQSHYHNPGEHEEAGHLHGMQGMITDAGVPSEEVYNAELHRLEHQYEDRLHGMSDANQRSENRNKNINMGHAERNYLRNQHQAQYHNALKPVAQLQNNVRVNNEHHHHL